MFFKKLVDKKNDKVKFKFIPKTNEGYISIKFGCIRFIDSYRVLSGSLDSLVKTLVDNSHKTLKNFKEEIVDNDEILYISIDKEEEEEGRTIEDLTKFYPDKINELEETSHDYLGENVLRILETGFPDKWKHLTKKLPYPYEYFNTIGDNKKPVDNLKKKDFFSKLKKDYPSDK